MSETTVQWLFGIVIVIVIGIAVGLYNHVRECRQIHRLLGRICEHVGMKE